MAQLADQITGEESSLVRSFEAAQEALARGGIATVDVGRVHVAAYSPFSPVSAIHQEVLALTLEARTRETVYRMTVEELAGGMKDLGWPFRPQPSDGEQLIEFLAAWIITAREVPDDPHSFTPLFLAEMALRQEPAIDLATGKANPSDVQFSLLELELFTAAFDRLIIFQQTSFSPSLNGAHVARLAPAESTDFAAQQGPCSKYRHLAYGPMVNMVLPLPVVQTFGDIGISFGVGEALGQAMEKFGIGKDDFGKALNVTGALARVWKVIAIYNLLTVEVNVIGDTPVHKGTEDQPLREVTFDARVGVSEEDWEEYQQKHGKFGEAADRILRDCMTTLGLPTLANIGEIARAVESYAVEWSIVQGSPNHVFWSPDKQDQNGSVHLGLWRSKLQAVSGYSAGAPFVVEIKPEKESDHPGYELNESVKVCAEVDASNAPNLSTFVAGAQGGLGLADPVADLIGGMILKIGKPKGCSVLDVTYHVPLPALFIQFKNAKYTYYGGDGGIGGLGNSETVMAEGRIEWELLPNGVILGSGTLPSYYYIYDFNWNNSPLWPYGESWREFSGSFTFQVEYDWWCLSAVPGPCLQPFWELTPRLPAITEKEGQVIRLFIHLIDINYPTEEIWREQFNPGFDTVFAVDFDFPPKIGDSRVVSAVEYYCCNSTLISRETYWTITFVD